MTYLFNFSYNNIMSMLNQIENLNNKKSSSRKSSDSPRYHIDQKAYESSGRSLGFIIYCRLSKEGKKVATNAGFPNGFGPPAEYMKIMATVCSEEADFLLPGTPITEAIFKLLISNANKPMTIDEIYSGLTEAWTSVIYLKNLSDEILSLILEKDNEYLISEYIKKKRKSKKIKD